MILFTPTLSTDNHSRYFFRFAVLIYTTVLALLSLLEVLVVTSDTSDTLPKERLVSDVSWTDCLTKDTR